MTKLTIKGLLAHKLRFALTAVAVLLGVAFLSGTLILTDTIKHTFDNLFADVYRGTDAVVRSREAIKSDFGPGEQRDRVPGELVGRVRAIDGVKTDAGFLQFFAQMVDKKGDAIGTPEMGAPTFGFNWVDVRALNPYKLEPGGKAPRGTDEVVIDAKTAADNDFAVGERIKILTPSAPKFYNIVGIAKFGDAESAGGASVALFETSAAQQIARAPDQFDTVNAVAEPGISQQELQQRIGAGLADRKLEVLTGEQITKENQDDIQDALQFFNTALLIFAFVALFVGSFIIFNTFSIVVAQRTREMALLRAVGASGRQVMASVLSEAVVVGILASIVGLGAGVLLSAGLKSLLAAFGFDLPAGGIQVLPRTIILSIVVGTVVALLSAIAPARRAARVPPVAAMRLVAVEARGHSGRRVVIGIVITALGVLALFTGLFGSSGIAFVGLGAFVIFLGVFVLGPVIARPVSNALGWPVARLRGMPGTLARENAIRNPKRTSATAAALMIGVALVGFITIFAASTKKSIDVQIDRAFKADFVISTGGGFGASDVGFSPALARSISRLPEVGAETPLRFNQADFDGSGHFFVALNAETASELFTLDVQQGRFADLGVDDVAISTDAADDHHWKIGSTIPVRFPTGNTTVTVGAIYGNGAKEGLSDYAFSLAAYDANYPQRIDNQIYVRLAPGVTTDEGRQAIERVVKPYPNAEVQDQSEFKQAQADQINQLLGLIYVLLLLAVIIALIGIANTLALSIYERTRELGLLRAVGMTRPQLRSTIRWEAVIIALLGTVLGLVIGLFFGWAIVEALKDEGISEFAPPGGQLILVVVLAGFAGVVAAIFPARRAAKLDVLRAVSSE